MDNTSPQPEELVCKPCSDGSCTDIHEEDDLKIFWLEGVEEGDLLISDYDLEKINDLTAEGKNLSLKRWVTVEKKVLVLNGKGHNILSVTPQEQSFRVSTDDKVHAEEVKRLIAEDEGCEQRVKTY
jgi:hypothetical protein